jgi:hypothetical protein
MRSSNWSSDGLDWADVEALARRAAAMRANAALDRGKMPI